MPDRVELVPASYWICPECGNGQFEQSVAIERSPEELREIRAELGVEPWDDGVLLTDPTEVRCRQCGASFATLSYQVDVDL